MTASRRCSCRPAGRWRGCARRDKRAGSEKRYARPSSSVTAMSNRISHTFIHVLDQDQALDFYVGKLGMVVHTDADLGTMRFLTLNFPGQPDVELVLMVPGPPAYDDATAAHIREPVTKGAAGGALIFHTDDCRSTYENLRAKGADS